MKRRVVGGIVVLMVSASLAFAQQDAGRDESETPREPVRRIKVLQNPYEIASFYRSSQAPSPAPGFGAYPLTDRHSMTDRYPIAGYYRQGGGQGRYSRFWSSSVGSRRGFAPVRSRRVGPSELCLFAPTFLAPAAPFAVDLDR